MRATLPVVLRESAAPSVGGCASARRLRVAGNPARDKEKSMRTENVYVRDEREEFILANGDAVVAAAKAHLRRHVRRGVALTSPSIVRDFLSVALGDRDREYFCVLCLDSRHRFLRFLELFRSTIDGASVHPREVVTLAIESQSAVVLLVHNLPSQVAEPSHADELITRRLKDSLSLIDVRVLDHLIVGGDTVLSFSEKGLL
jgi:DNA repair protein RadC